MLTAKPTSFCSINIYSRPQDPVSPKQLCIPAEWRSISYQQSQLRLFDWEHKPIYKKNLILSSHQQLALWPDVLNHPRRVDFVSTTVLTGMNTVKSISHCVDKRSPINSQGERGVLSVQFRPPKPVVGLRVSLRPYLFRSGKGTHQNFFPPDSAKQVEGCFWEVQTGNKNPI